jgi:6-phospho-beta-glucosidase
MVQDIIRKHREIPIAELCIHDIEPQRLQTIGALVEHLVRQAGSPFRVALTTDFVKAVQGADFIYTAIRVGGEEGRAVDERVALRHGVLGQETTGPGGFAMALRTIPVMLEYAELIERHAPNAWVVNFTNPAGLIAEALHKHSRLKVIGICDAPSAMRLDLARFLNVPAAALHINYFGLNHLGWINRVLVGGQDRLPDIIANYEALVRLCPHMACFSGELIRQLGMLPNEYLYYYYYRDQAVGHIRGSKETRGEQIVRLNRRLFAELGDALRTGGVEEGMKLYSAIMLERQNSYMAAEAGGAHLSTAEHDQQQPEEQFVNEGYAGLALSIMSGIYNNSKVGLIVNVPNRGAIEGLRPDDVVEVPCVLDANGPLPLAVGPVPEAVKGLLQSVKQYERHTVEAAVSGSYEEAWMALAAHPLVGSHTLAKSLLDDYLQQHERYLPKFKQKGTVYG